MSRPLHVLVVEDNMLNLVLVRDLLTHAGHEVVAAEDIDRLAVILRDPPAVDVVLMDIQVPGGGGVLGLEKVRATLGDVPTAALTAFAMSGDRERFLEAGFDTYMSKPIAVSTFVASVEALAAGGGGET